MGVQSLFTNCYLCMDTYSTFLLHQFPVYKMGIQASTIKIAAGKLAPEPRKKGSKRNKVRIEILAFEVASVMSKSAQLWQSLTDQEIRRFRGEVIKSEGVLNLVSDNESVLLSLACMEKLQDLTTMALAVTRLGKRCQEPALIGFEHIYNDILKQSIDINELEFSYKEMDAKMKKMERYIGTTSSLYQELEILSEMEQAIRRLREDNDPAQRDNLYVLDQKVVWQRQEIKYLKEVSLWNRTYDKIVGILARTVCTIYGRIIRVFGFPIMGWPQILMASNNGEVEHSGSITSCLSTEEPKLSNGSLNGYTSPVLPGHMPRVAPSMTEAAPYHVQTSNGSSTIMRDQNAMIANGFSNALRDQNVVTVTSCSSPYQSNETYMSLSMCFSPGRQFGQQRSMSANYASRDSIGSSPIGMPFQGNFASRSRNDSECLQSDSGPFGVMANKGINKLLFDPKTRLQNAPSSTLGGAGLALHYANVVIIAEKMIRYPHLISQDARDDLYHMLPRNVRVALRSRLRSHTKLYGSSECDGEDADWKELLERVLGWLAPLAHNMIRWQSEHNFEQQQMVPRTNVLLLQTLYFANQLKAEAEMTDLLVGLNMLWRHERDSKANSLMEYASNRDYDEYLEWQM